MRDPLVERMLSTISRFSMLESGQMVLVAVSGGPDSVALLHALWALRDELGVSLHVAHLNHSFRGSQSDEDAEYVRTLAENLLLPCTVEKVDVPDVQRSLRLSPEEAARLVRYDFLKRTADEVSAARIATGHTADDQVETVLLNLLRGTGVDGLSGMLPVRGRIIRPLIETSRAQVEEYIREYELDARVDETNLLPEYTRNKVRLELLPLLRHEFNPEIDSALLRLSELAREDTAYLDIETQGVLSRITMLSSEGEIALNAEALGKLHLAIRRRLVRETVRVVRGSLSDIGFGHVEEILRLLDAGSDFRYELPGGTFVERDHQAVRFLSSRPPEQPIIYCYEVAVPGITSVPEIGVLVETESSLTPISYLRPAGSLEVVLDQDALVGTLAVRNWRPGDRIRPLGMKGSKKVQDIFVDRKIPRSMRHRVPLIADNEKIVWVVGLTISEDVKVTAATRSFLRIAVAPADLAAASNVWYNVASSEEE